jgi:hypothetical protein
VPATTRNTNHSCQRCSATDLGQYKDGRKKSYLLDFFQIFLLWLTPPFF